jgi:hypothetical protein
MLYEDFPKKGSIRFDSGLIFGLPTGARPELMRSWQIF